MTEPTPSPLKRCSAVLLLGPTGSGKTPLGDLLATRGWQGRRCLHFDFGAELRRLVQANRPGEIVSQNEIDFLRRVLDSGALLEDEHFPLAARILGAFLLAHDAEEDTWVVLNGLPRHAGQARAVEAIVRVRGVVQLQCSAETVLARIRGNAGGDRAGRIDDDPPAVGRKLATFRERTAPLVMHYRRQGAWVETIAVTADMTPEQMWSGIT